MFGIKDITIVKLEKGVGGMGECTVRKAIRISQSGTMVSLLFVIKFTPNGHILSVKLRLKFGARNVCHIHYQRNRCSEKKKNTFSLHTVLPA